MHDPSSQLAALVRRHAGPLSRELLPGVTLWSSFAKSMWSSVVYEPMLYFPLQGTKLTAVGERRLAQRPGTFMVASDDVPVLCGITDCSAEQPYLGVTLTLDRGTLSELLADVSSGPRRPVASADEGAGPIAISATTRAMEDALLRLVSLVDAPDDVPLLAPMFERELLYRVLQSERGALLRKFARHDGRRAQVARAVRHIRAHLAEPLPMKTLASVAAMSVTSFHRHFKAVTGLSPLAYHKQLRLREARARLLSEPGGVASVAFSVGYESVSQFSREYAREFGLSPARDAARLRAS
jgi:AraC-like DNA-binding protein